MKKSQVDLNNLYWAFEWALRLGQLEAVKILVKAGADIHVLLSNNIPGHPDQSPLEIAAWRNVLRTVRYLMSEGAGSRVNNLRKAKLICVFDWTWSVQTKFKALQALGAFPDFSFPDISLPETISRPDYEVWRFCSRPEIQNPPNEEQMGEWVMREEILKQRRLLEQEEIDRKGTHPAREDKQSCSTGPSTCFKRSGPPSEQ